MSPVLNAAAITANLLDTNPFEVLLTHSAIKSGYTVTWSVSEFSGNSYAPSISDPFTITSDPKVLMTID